MSVFVLVPYRTLSFHVYTNPFVLRVSGSPGLVRVTGWGSCRGHDGQHMHPLYHIDRPLKERIGVSSADGCDAQ